MEPKALKYSKEQEEIIATACAPSDDDRLVRVTAAAGTGKTTTIIGVAARLCSLGHEGLTYLTFNVSAAADGAKRLGPSVCCRTIHAQALHCLNMPNPHIKDESAVERLITKHCEDDIKTMCQRISPKGDDKSLHKKLAKTLSFYIRKTLERFTNSADPIDVGFDPQQWFTTYYPAKRFHQQPPAGYEDIGKCGDFYVHNARKIYELLRPDPDTKTSKAGYTTYDVMMKECQLQGCKIPGSALLVDESQDCSECQIAWIESNREGKVIYLVGDAVQTIYGFRGAKSKFLLGVRNCIDKNLTTSFRFGKHIASVANSILFVKQKVSPNDWRHYRLTGGANSEGEVFFSSPNVSENEIFPLTVLAFSNHALLAWALQYFARQAEDDRKSLSKPLLRFAVNGDGENSGRKRWLSVLKNIQACIKLYTGAANSLPDFPEFEGEEVSWDEFKEAVTTREMGKYYLHVKIVDAYKEDTATVMQAFKEDVIDANHPKEHADIILSTIHAAKGAEWENVLICEDMSPLHGIKVEEDRNIQKHGFQRADSFQGLKKRASFTMNEWKNEINLWYVAVTRAKRRLFLPKKLEALFQCYGEVKAMAESNANELGLINDEDASLPFSGKQMLSLDDVRLIAEHIVCPWIVEMTTGGHLDSPVYDMYRKSMEKKFGDIKREVETQEVDSDEDAAATTSHQPHEPVYTRGEPPKKRQK